MLTDRLHRRFYTGPQYDGTGVFYAWVRQHINASTVMLNLGAGPATQNPTRILKGEVKSIAGADVDRCVLSNGELDSAHMIENGRLPFADQTFDVVFSDYVLEHVEHPDQFLSETCRVLKPSGCFLFRTPNVYHYVALISAATPHWFHDLVAHRARANPQDSQEPWPTFYRLNSRRAIRAAGLRAGFSASELRMIEMEPSYLRFMAVPFAMGIAYERLVNSSEAFASLRANIFGKLVK